MLSSWDSVSLEIKIALPIFLCVYFPGLPLSIVSEKQFSPQRLFASYVSDSLKYKEETLFLGIFQVLKLFWVLYQKVKTASFSLVIKYPLHLMDLLCQNWMYLNVSSCCSRSSWASCYSDSQWHQQSAQVYQMPMNESTAFLQDCYGSLDITMVGIWEITFPSKNMNTYQICPIFILNAVMCTFRIY